MENALKILRMPGRYVRQDEQKAIDRVNQAAPTNVQLMKVSSARAAKIDAIRKTIGLKTV